MESYTDMKYSDCGCSGRCRKVSGNRNQSVRSCLDPAMQAGSGVRYLREREIVHYQRFGEALRITQEKLDSKNFYAFNPSFDNGKSMIQPRN